MAKSFDDTTILDDVDNKIEQITTKQPEPESFKKAYDHVAQAYLHWKQTRDVI